jgi:hypothetical protein
MKKRERRKRYDDGFAYPEKQVKGVFRKALPDFEVLWKGCFNDYNFDDYHQSVELSGVSCQSLDCASSCRDLCGYTGYGIASVCFRC